MRLTNFKYPYLNVWVLMIVCLIISIWNIDYLQFVLMLILIKIFHLIEDVIEHYVRRR